MCRSKKRHQSYDWLKEAVCFVSFVYHLCVLGVYECVDREGERQRRLDVY